MSNQDSINDEYQSFAEKRNVDLSELKIKINKMYTNVALNPNDEYHFKMGRELAEILGYPSIILDKIPQKSIESFAGVGYFFDLANLVPGEKILDLGSGSGMDAFYAANQVGEEGKVTGIDMNLEQISKAEEMKNKYDIENIEFIKSDIENLPLGEKSYDVVISNGVFNLIHNKQDLFHQIQRILKQDGRLVFADIVTENPLPSHVKCDSTLWASCIGGAEQKDVYIEMIEKAGLKVMRTKLHEKYSFISDQARNASGKWGVRSYSFLCHKGEIINGN